MKRNKNKKFDENFIRDLYTITWNGEESEEEYKKRFNQKIELIKKYEKGEI